MENHAPTIDPATTYEAAYAELQSILQALQGPAVSIEALRTQVARAAALLAFCQRRLREVETEVQQILPEE